MYMNQIQDVHYLFTDEQSDDESEDGDADLRELCRIYPQCDPSTLSEVLQAQGSIEGVRELLG